jgi:hypothetical protein
MARFKVPSDLGRICISCGEFCRNQSELEKHANREHGLKLRKPSARGSSSGVQPELFVRNDYYVAEKDSQRTDDRI